MAADTISNTIKRFIIISDKMCSLRHTIVLSLMLLFVCACKEPDNTIGGTGYLYHLRPCNYLNVNNARLQKVSYTDDKNDEHGFVIKQDMNEEAIIYDNYLIRLCVNGVKRDYPFFLYPYKPAPDITALELDPEPIMEQQIKAFYENQPRTRSGFELNVIHIEYRNEALEDLKVFATETLYGKGPGECLNEKVSVYGGPEPFYFDAYKNLIPTKEYPWGSLTDYMDFSPMTPAILYLQLHEKPQEVPVTLRFAVELKVEGKAPFRDTTRTVTLL